MTAHEDTIFGKIIRREIPAQIVHETETVLAFKDIDPQAPTHILIIPKQPIRGLSDAKPEHREVLGELLLTASELARKLNLDGGGYRVVINNGVEAGQTVFHLHVHLLGQRKFAWPPG